MRGRDFILALGVLTRFAGSVAAAVGPANYQAHQHQNTCENSYLQALIHATYICIWIPYICIVNCICLCIFISARLAVTHLCSNWTSRAVCAFDLKFSFIVRALLSSILSLSRSLSLSRCLTLAIQSNQLVVSSCAALVFIFITDKSTHNCRFCLGLQIAWKCFHFLFGYFEKAGLQTGPHPYPVCSHISFKTRVKHFYCHHRPLNKENNNN